jgi:hypothetical protein
MKRLFLIAGLMTAFGLAVLAASAAAPANFAGTWALDKTKSTGLSQRLQSADSVTWTITQDDKQISIETKVSGGQPPAGGGSGGGGGQGRGPAGPQTYTLDGKEVTTEAMGGTATMKATWSSDGKTLELTSVRAGSFNGNEFKATATDKLSLSGDGKVLTVNRHSEGTRGTTDSTMVLNKQ